MKRDLTEAQFAAACARHGLEYTLGGLSVRIGPTLSHGVMVGIGGTRRADLAYVLAEHKRLCAAQGARRTRR